MQGGEAPARPLGFQDLLMQLVHGGGGGATAAAAEGATVPGDGDEVGGGAQPAAEDTAEERGRAMEALLEHMRDAFGGENGA